MAAEATQLKEVSLSGHQNQVNIHHYNNPFYTINGRPATEQDSHIMLLGSLESAEREIVALKDASQSKDGQIALQMEIIGQLRAEVTRQAVEIARLKESNRTLMTLIE